MAGDENDPIALLPRLAVVARCREAGITRVLFPAPAAADTEVCKALDAFAKLRG
jgi:hypothetical protein